MKSLNDNIFYKYQSSFRGNYSTDIFQSFLNENILRSFDNELYCGMILAELQKGTWCDIPQNSVWWRSSNRHFREYDQLVWSLSSRLSLYCRGCKSGYKICKYLMRCSKRFNFRPSSVVFFIHVNDISKTVRSV